MLVRILLSVAFINLLFIAPAVLAEGAADAESAERVGNRPVATSGVQMAVDLKRSAEQLKQTAIPIMLFFAAEDCVYCERLEADYLHGMANSADYRKRVMIRKIVIDSYDEFLDFNGKNIEAFDFSDIYDIQVTPTLVFVDTQGVRVSKRLIGYNDAGFFGAELDDVIAFASKQIKSAD